MSEEHKAKTLEMIAIMQAYVEGKPIEARSISRHTDWMPWPHPGWDWGTCEYRIATTPDTINWDHVSPEWKWMARQRNGTPVLWAEKPLVNFNGWGSLGRSAIAEVLVSYVRGTVDWKDSLVKRPD